MSTSPLAATTTNAATSAPTSDWHALKLSAASQFAAKRFDEARRGYEAAIDAIEKNRTDTASAAAAASNPPSSASASAADLCVLHSNVSACAFQLGDYSGALAAADRALAADPSFLKAHLRRALALEKLATTNPTAGSGGEPTGAAQSVLHLQDAIRTTQKIAQILQSQQAHSQQNSTTATTSAANPASASGPSLAEVTTTLVRLRSTLATLHARAASPLPFLQALHETAAATPAAASDASTAASKDRATLRALMQLIASSGAARVEALQGDLIDVLLQLSLREPLSMRTRAAAVSALRYILGTDLASSSSSGAAPSALDIAPLRASAPDLLRLFESLRGLQSSQGKQVPPPLPNAVAALGDMLRALCGLLARLAVHPRLEHAFTAPICSALAAALPRYSTHSPAALAALWGSASASTGASSASIIRLCIAAIDALTFVASSPFVPAPMMGAIRQEWLGLLLLEPLAAAAAHDEPQAANATNVATGVVGGAQLRAAILGAVAVLTRNAMPRAGSGAAASAAAANSVLASMSPMLSKAFGSAAQSPAQGEMSEEQLKALEAEGAQIREQSLRLIYAPLIGAIEAPSTTTAAAASSASSDLTPVKLNYTAATRLVRGLSLLLQANTMLGIFVVTFGAAKSNEASSGSTKKMDSVQEEAEEEQKHKESADPASTAAAAAAAPTSAAASPTVLHLLLSLSSYVSQPPSSSSAANVAPPKPLQLLAAEVLALASSDASIRSTLVAVSSSQAAEDEELRVEGIATAARGADVFMDLIVQYTEARDLGIEEDAGQQDKTGKGSTREESKQHSQPPAPPMADGEAAVVPNETIVAHACLALSKLVAVGEWGSSAPLPPRASSSASASAADQELETEELDISDAAHTDLAILLHILSTLIEKHVDSVPRVERAADLESKAAAKKAAAAKAAAAASKGGDSDDADDLLSADEDSSTFLSESLRLQRVSLLHLLFESLSYLSLHAYAKKWIVAERRGRAIRMLVGIATGTASPALNGSTASSVSSSSSAAAAGTLGVVSDSTIRYALLHCFRNLVTSRSSLQAAHNAEVEALKKLASRGLGAAAGPGGGAALNEQQNARQQYLAGSAEMIAVLSKVLTGARVGAALVALHKAYVIQAQEMEGLTTIAAKPDAASASSSAAAAKSGNAILSAALANTFAFTLLQLATLPDNRGSLVQQGCVRLLLDLYAGATKPGDGSAAASAASNDENASPNSPNSPFRASTDCLSALARLFISTNPALVSETQLPSVVRVLLEGLASSEHELQTFETLMALTNLASFKSGGAAAGGEEGGLDLAEHICVGAASARSTSTTAAGPSSRAASRSADDLNGWYLAKSNLVSSNVMVQRACVELMTNLVGCTWVRTRLRAVPVEIRMAQEPGLKITKAEHAASYAAALANPSEPQSEDLRLLLAFALSEDLATARAATGALAMLSNDELIAARIAATRVVSYVSLDAAAEEKRAEDPSVVSTTAEEGRQAPPNTRPLVRSGMSICAKLLSDPQTHPDVKLRVKVLQDNLAASTQAGTVAKK